MLKNRTQVFEDLSKMEFCSTNSSKPPSADGPGVVRPKQQPSSRKQGGQPGHGGKKRELLPAEEIDHIVDFYPPACEICSLELNPALNRETSDPFRHQTVDLPDIQLIKTEYRCHELECDNGHRTRADLPPEITQSNFGPRVHAATTYLIAEHLATRRGIVEIMKTLFNLDLSLGAVCNTVERVSTQLQPIVEQVRETLQESKTLNIDETGWKSQGKRLNLWAFVSPLVVYFCIAASRGAKVLKSVLGDAFQCIITSHDHSAYRAYQKGIRQLCWAHLIRKFKELKETRSSPDAYSFSKNMLKEAGHLFTCNRSAVPGSRFRVLG